MDQNQKEQCSLYETYRNDVILDVAIRQKWQHWKKQYGPQKTV